MADISNKAEELAGRAKEAAGDLTGNDDLKADGAADQARAQVKQGVEAVADKAQDAVDTVSEAASNGAEVVSEKAGEVKAAVSDTAEQLNLDDRRVLVIAAVAGITLTLTLLVRRARSNPRRKVAKAAKKATKKAASAGLGRALNR